MCVGGRGGGGGGGRFLDISTAEFVVETFTPYSYKGQVRKAFSKHAGVLGMGYIILLCHSLSLPYNYFVWQRYSICMIVIHSMTSLNPTNRFYSTHWLQTDKHIKENKGMVAMMLGLCPSNSQGHLYLGPLFEFHRWGSFSTASRRHFRS